MKIFRSEIWIDKFNHWWNGNTRIVNNGVILLFKMNLHFDNDYYIYLEYKENSEKGYLKTVEGFPILCKDVDLIENSITFSLDNQGFSEPDKIFYDENKELFWSIWYDSKFNSYLPFLITSSCIQILQPYILENNENNLMIKYHSKELPIIKKYFDPYHFF